MKKNRQPGSKEVIDAIVERFSKMTPEERYEFLTYRTPGVEMTDMTGMFGDIPAPAPKARAKRRTASG